MVSKLYSIGVFGIETFTVEVEADISVGLPGFDIVGLPDTAVKESRGRVRSSAKNCGLEFPVSRVTVNLAPADVKKEGAIYDLPVLIAILSAAGQISADLSDTAFIGELSLTGEIRPVCGLLAMAIHAKHSGFKRFFIPKGNAAEASAVSGIDIIREEDWGNGVSRGDAVLDIVKAAARAAKDPEVKSAMVNAAIDQYSKGNIIMDQQGAFVGLLASKGIETFFG